MGGTYNLPGGPEDDRHPESPDLNLPLTLAQLEPPTTPQDSHSWTQYER